MPEFIYEEDFTSWIYDSTFSDPFKEFLTGYLEAGLFTHIENLNSGKQSMIENESIMEAFADCVKFMNNNRMALDLANEYNAISWRRLGNLFMFSRNGEGTGFWDIAETFVGLGENLQSNAKKFGEWMPELKS